MLIDLQPRGLLLLCRALPDAPALSSLSRSSSLQPPGHRDIPTAPMSPGPARPRQPHGSSWSLHFLVFWRQVPGLAVLATKDL